MIRLSEYVIDTKGVMPPEDILYDKKVFSVHMKDFLKVSISKVHVHDYSGHPWEVRPEELFVFVDDELAELLYE